MIRSEEVTDDQLDEMISRAKVKVYERESADRRLLGEALLKAIKEKKDQQ